MSGIKKINPTDIELLKHIYGLISNTENSNFKNLSWETFLECRDNIYVYLNNSNGFDSIDAVIACRRTTMDKIDLVELPYYCKPHYILYSIECMYISREDNVEKTSDVVCQLVEEECRDKADAFICLRVYSAENKCHRYVTNLLGKGFRFANYDKNVWYFLKSPINNK